MTWSTFAGVIRDAQITNVVPWRIINDLFVEAGCPMGLAEPTVRKWFNGERNCDSRRYFPDQKIDSDKVFAFFKNRPTEKLQNLQKSFQEKIDAGDPIDVNTKDLDTFCWSLVNQFLDLLKFERVDIPQPSGDTTDIGTKPFLHEHKCCLYCIHWKCTASITEIFRGPLSGICHKYNGNRHSLSLCLSSTAACSDYKENENLNEQDERAWFQR